MVPCLASSGSGTWARGSRRSACSRLAPSSPPRPPRPRRSRAAVRYAYEIRGGAERVDVGVYDIAGRAIRGLFHGTQSPGRCEIVWDGLSDVGARVRGAVYFLRASVGTSARISRIVLVK